MPVEEPITDRAEIFKRKRAKNLVLLLALLAWVALIFFITIAKIAHAADPAPNFKAHDPYAAGEVAHQAKMNAEAQKLRAGAAAHQAKMNQDLAALQAGNQAHQTKMQTEQAHYLADGKPYLARSQSAQSAMQTAGLAHVQAMAGKPQSWWRDWLSRHGL